MNRSLNKLLVTLMLVSGMSLATTASTELIAQENAAEANQVSILFTNGTEQGLVQVRQCAACPLNLDLDGQTRFFHKGKEISRDKVQPLSGKPGTVTYSKDGKQTHKILW